MKIVFATGNANKLVEVRAILGDLASEVISMKDAGIKLDIVEDGKTFEENALIKARAVAECMPDALVLADDSGLEVDALNKEPGIYSARYMGEDTSYDIKNKAIIDRLAGLSGDERSARFVCAIAACFKDKNGKRREIVVRGNFEGQIAHEIVGENGFGYDPIFFVPEFNCTSAEMTPEQKNSMSHRGNALRAMRELLKEEL